MKYSIIGSSHGVPEANRKCTCIMVEIQDSIYFIDMGTSAIDALAKRGKAVDAVKGVFITHMHGDHTDGLIQFIDLITWYYQSANPAIFMPDLDAVQVVDDWLRVTQNGCTRKLDFRQTQEGKLYDDGMLKVTAISTQHCPGSHAYLLEAENKRVLCTGDLLSPSDDFPWVDGQLDLMICECAHFSAMEYLPVLEKLDLKKVCFTHYSPKRMYSLYELQNELIKRNLPVVIATDDLELIL